MTTAEYKTIEAGMKIKFNRYYPSADKYAVEEAIVIDKCYVENVTVSQRGRKMMVHMSNIISIVEKYNPELQQLNELKDKFEAIEETFKAEYKANRNDSDYRKARQAERTISALSQAIRELEALNNIK